QHRPSRERKNKNDRLFHIKNYSAQERPSNYQSPSSHHLCQVHNPLNGARRRGSELCCRFVGGANKFFVLEFIALRRGVPRKIARNGRFLEHGRKLPITEDLPPALDRI